MRLTVVLEKSVSCDKRLVDFLDDSSKRRLRVSILLAVLADRGRPLCPLFLSPTLPVSLNFSRRRLIVRLLGGFLPGKYLLNCREWRLPISLQNMPPQSLTSLAQYIELLDPLMPWDENLRLYLWFTWKWERYVSYINTWPHTVLAWCWHLYKKWRG